MSFFKADRHSATESNEECPDCGTMGISGQRCPNPACGRKHGPNVGQVFLDPFLDVGRTANRSFSKGTSPARGPVGCAGVIAVALALSFVGFILKQCDGDGTSAAVTTPPPLPTVETVGSGGEFDRSAAYAALGAVDLSGCRMPDGPRGAGHVTVTFERSGVAGSVVIDGGDYPKTPVGKCIAERYRSARVPSFAGDARKIGKSFSL